MAHVKVSEAGHEGDLMSEFDEANMKTGGYLEPTVDQKWKFNTEPDTETVRRFKSSTSVSRRSSKRTDY